MTKRAHSATSGRLNPKPRGIVPAHTLLGIGAGAFALATSLPAAFRRAKPRCRRSARATRVVADVLA
jgi:hypothetical protein